MSTTVLSVGLSGSMSGTDAVVSMRRSVPIANKHWGMNMTKGEATLSKAAEPFYMDEAFSNTDDGIWYQCRITEAMTFIQPTIEDELLAHTMGVQLWP